MKIEECSYCGILSLTEGNICQSCRTIAGADQNPAQATAFAPAENFQPVIRQQENFPSPNQPEYHPQQRVLTQIECWKCRTVNIWEQTKICQRCGCYLKAVNVAETRKAQKESAKFKWFVGIFVISFVLIFGVVAVTKTIFYVTSGDRTGLPPNSWFKPTFSNYFRDKPTIEEIIEKNDSVISKTIKPGDVKTISFNGNISLAIGGCATPECLQQKQANKQAQMQAVRKSSGFNPLEWNSPETLDNGENFDNQNYIELGRVEALEIKPDKLLRKSFMHRIRGSEKKDVLECLNGEKGWSRSTTYEHDGKISVAIEDIVGDELAQLKSSTTSQWQNVYKDFELTNLGIQSLNDQKEFVLQKQDGEKVEKLYFNAATGYVDKIEDGKMTGYLSLYQEFNGVKMPNKMCYKSLSKDGLVIWLKIDNIEWHINEPIDEAIFEKPIE